MGNKHYHIILVGLPASYKSLLGKLLAEFLEFKFLDLDNIISNSLHLSVCEIFEQFGEKYFREMEEKLFFENIKIMYKSVLSLGGGSFINYNIRKYSKQNCLSIFLDTKTSIIANNIFFEKNKRPMFKKLKNILEITKMIETIKQRRIKFYLEADYKIEINKKIDEKNGIEVIKKIIKMIGL